MKIILYTTHCPKCSVLQQKLDAAKIDYEVCDDVDIMVEKGFLAAPNLEVDGDVMSFKEAVDWVNARR